MQSSRHFLLAALALFACNPAAHVPSPPVAVSVGKPGEAPAPPTSEDSPAPTVTPAEAPIEPGPVVVGPRIVDPQTGKVVHELPAHAHGMAMSEAPGRYRIGSVVIDTATRAAISPTDDVTIDSSGVIKHGPKGWRFPLAGARSVRPPDLALTKSTAVVAVDSELVGIDRVTGKQAWRLSAPNDRLHAVGDLVLSLESNANLSAVPKRWLIARHANDGSEAYRVELPRESDPEALANMGDHLLVRNRHPHSSLVIDHEGRVAFQLHERISTGIALGSDWLVVTNERVARLDAHGAVQWELSGFENDFVMESSVVLLPDGDALVENHGAISDSGVELVRVELATGKVRWKRVAAALGVGHSKYRHVAYAVRIPGDALAVVSQGSYGSWVETLRADTGGPINRWEFR